MISKPEAICPRCGSRMTVMDVIDVSKYAETVTWYCECDCGAAHLTLTRGQITGITPCEPLAFPEDTDEPEGSQEDPDYMVITERG